MEGWRGLNCINEVESGSFGEITFQCVGQNVTDVDSYMAYLGGGSIGGCTAGEEGGGRNYHIAQMGIQCPDALGPYIFDDHHFECNSEAIVGKFNGRYSCYSGVDCQSRDCEIEDVFVNADSHNFHECIEALGDIEVGPEPPVESIQTDSDPGFYRSRFQANWQLKLNTTICEGEFATKRISCLEGSQIANVEPLFDNVECAMVNSSIVECNDTTAEHFINEFSGVQYDCVGSTLPETMVEYLSANSVCVTGTLTDKQVGHNLQLGVLCDVLGTNTTVLTNLDTFFECGEDNDFDIIDGIYTCQQINKYDRFSPEVVVPVALVTMGTDFRWSSHRPDLCFDFQNETMAPTEEVEAETGELNNSAEEPITGNADPGAEVPISRPPTPIAPGQPVSPTTPSPSTFTAAPTSEAPTIAPLPPADTMYKIDYMGRFQQVVSSGCVQSNPAIVLTCEGEIGGVSTSHPSIECGPEAISLDDGRSAMLCENTCAGASCENIFLSTDGPVGSKFGEVYFTCSGPAPNDVDGTFIIVGDGSGTFCDGTDPSGNSHNLNMAQLAIKCPTENGALDYVVDSAHAECGVPRDPVNGSAQNRPISVDGRYTCYAGKACGEEACLVDIKQLIVAADPHHFESCTQTDNGSTVPELDTPTVPSMEAGIYIASFKAHWDLNFDDGCDASASPILVTCTNGIIREINSVGTDSRCEATSDSTLECSDSAISGGIVYYVSSKNGCVETLLICVSCFSYPRSDLRLLQECESDSEIPETHVEYVQGKSGDMVEKLRLERSVAHLRITIIYSFRCCQV